MKSENDVNDFFDDDIKEEDNKEEDNKEDNNNCKISKKDFFRIFSLD